VPIGLVSAQVVNRQEAASSAEQMANSYMQPSPPTPYGDRQAAQPSPTGLRLERRTQPGWSDYDPETEQELISSDSSFRSGQSGFPSEPRGVVGHQVWEQQVSRRSKTEKLRNMAEPKHSAASPNKVRLIMYQLREGSCQNVL
jgi:hypothetical protein